MIPVRDPYRHAVAIVLIAAVVVIGAVDAARAAVMTIVALGTSNTYGFGVARDQSYPAQLQAMLRARGLDTVVINAGVNGDSSAGMLMRLASAVPSSTRLVILETHPANERRNHVAGQTRQNVMAIKSRLRMDGIDCIDISSAMAAAVRQAVANGAAPTRRGGHLTAVGYATLVSSLLPQVAAALSK